MPMPSPLGRLAELAGLHGRPLALRAAGWGAAALGATLALVFLLVALHLWLAPRLGAAPAALLVALIVALLGAAAAAILLSMARTARYKAQRASVPLLVTLPLIRPMLAKAAPKLIVAAMVTGAGFELLRRR